MSGYSPLFASLRAWRRDRERQKVNDGVLKGVLDVLCAAAKANPGVPQTEKFGSGSITVTFGEEKRPKTYVVARNYRAAADWAYRNNLRVHQWVYVSRPETLRGLTNPQIMFLSWPQSWLPEQIEEYLTNLALARRHQ
jgi:hypothetical protein